MLSQGTSLKSRVRVGAGDGLVASRCAWCGRPACQWCSARAVCAEVPACRCANCVQVEARSAAWSIGSAVAA